MDVMLDEDEGFKPIILNILNRWSGLKLAVEHQMGGRTSREKAWNLVNDLVEMFQENCTVDVEDLEEMLIQYMDSEYQTIFEDDSIIELARTFTRLFELYKTSPQQAYVELNKLPQVQPWLTKLPTTNNIQMMETGAREERTNDGQHDGEEPSEEQANGWKIVSYKRT